MQIYLFFQRKINLKPAAGPIPVVPAVPAQLSGADRAAVECDCVSHDGEPEAGPLAFIGRRNPEEALEYLLEILFLHTSPGIVVSDQQLAVGAFVRLDVNHKVPARVLERILHQIPEQRVEQALIAVHAGFGTHEVFDPDPAADYAALQLFKDILKYVPYPDVFTTILRFVVPYAADRACRSPRFHCQVSTVYSPGHLVLRLIPVSVNVISVISK